MRGRHHITITGVPSLDGDICLAFVIPARVCQLKDLDAQRC